MTSRRDRKSRVERDRPSVPSTPGTFWLVLKVLAEVEHGERGLVLARAEQVLAQPRATSGHLPELRLRPHELEEHEVHDLGHVDGRVKHVDGDRNMRRRFLQRELVDQALRILGSVRDDARESTA